MSFLIFILALVGFLSSAAVATRVVLDHLTTRARIKRRFAAIHA